MNEKHNDNTLQRPAGARVLDAPLVQIDLPKYMQEIKTEEPWHKTDRNAITIYKTEDLTIVLVALHQGAEMKPHATNGILTLQLIEGKITFGANEQEIELAQQQMVTLHENIKHSVKAESESVFLLTVINKK
ncbi:MAG: hypothetical protein JSS96_07875 [Bacteroidetes bacterium]|nr:hypothetical protein [Bacteroidota bacterium]